MIGREIDKFTVTRRCRGAEYVIRVNNRGAGDRAPRLTVDGTAIQGDLVAYAPAGSRVVVDCEV